ncbi:TetR/AcrR family transcriptional regulator [Alcanivorax sp. DP30]|uniref:TetR/AcrR family transcriptional regulator n=1 Tax=Alcanivorax sp. DP30 TaxID=2606217 RepID=UPI0013699AB2|nr:TetR/AcrR family transcriptional regulator [Alcanivorax sp. DP30]MZR63906.1 TetR family transcriptional regulator [Alcanivorax sp. DP30]
MTDSVTDKLQLREQRNSQKRNEKKALIADSALQALHELGFANTSLRDIAARAGLSLGMLHYYFEDKTALIAYCVKTYKSGFMASLEGALAGEQDRAAVVARLSGVLAFAIFNDGPTHRLWYDIRNQALFDPAFRETVNDIEQSLVQVMKNAWVLAGHSDSSFSPLVYSAVDGAFQYLVHQQALGVAKNQQAIAGELQWVLERIL